MARFARVIALQVAHHVTQRGNARQFILDGDVDRKVYLDLLRENADKHQASLVGYCLMSNHVHLVMVPRQADALAKALKNTHGRYAAYWNGKYNSSGHVWQGRFYSCPLDTPHLWEALRYAELNPVRAGLVAEAEVWPWSSAAAHCGFTVADEWLAMEEWKQRWDVSSWKDFLAAGETESERMAIRECTHTGRPLGTEEFVHELEEATKRTLAPQKGGRPVKIAKDKQQGELF
jgi:REP-associated tyrosine transposase